MIAIRCEWGGNALDRMLFESCRWAFVRTGRLLELTSISFILSKPEDDSGYAPRSQKARRCVLEDIVSAFRAVVIWANVDF